MYPHEAHERVAAARDPLPRTDAPPALNPRLWPGFTRYLAGRGLSPDLARENGWYPADHRGPRVVIPAVASDGHVFWQARSMDDREPRYMSPRYARRDAFVWIWPHGRARTGVVVCEGPMDALAAAEAGHYGAAMMGAEPPYAAIVHLALWCARSYTRRALIVPDADEIGPVLSKVGLTLASLGIESRTLSPRGKDLASMTLTDRQRFLKEAK